MPPNYGITGVFAYVLTFGEMIVVVLSPRGILSGMFAVNGLAGGEINVVQTPASKYKILDLERLERHFPAVPIKVILIDADA